MSARAAQVELVESIAESDGKLGNAPRPGWTISESKRRQPQGGADPKMLEERYWMYYEAASEHPTEAADVVVRWKRQAAR